MKGYISIKEASEKWGISERRVNQYCTEGRIDGAVMFGAVWAIPENAEKPKDLRRKNIHINQNLTTFDKFMPLMNTLFTPGTCKETIKKIKNPDKKNIALAEYYYFTGQSQKAIKQAEPYITYKDPSYRLSACWIYAYACFTEGKISHAQYALSEIRNTLINNGKSNPDIKAIQNFAAFGSSVLLHLPVPEEMPPIEKFMPLLPNGLRGFALYLQAHYLYLKKEYSHSVGIAEATLSMGAGAYPIPAIYLHLVAVMDYMSLKNTEKAYAHLLTAWKMAQPDDLIEGFGEHHGLLGGMLEAVIKPNYPEDFKRIIDITYRFSAGWRKIHNPETGHNVADILTTTEFAIAMLAARNWTNQEIANHLNISSNTVKKHLSETMKKLNITNRKNLKQYMLL